MLEGPEPEILCLGMEEPQGTESRRKPPEGATLDLERQFPQIIIFNIKVWQEKEGGCGEGKRGRQGARQDKLSY